MNTTVSPIQTDAIPVAVWLAFTAAAICLLGAGLNAVAPQSAITWASCALAVWCTGLICLIGAVRGNGGLGLAQWKLGSWMLAWCAVTSGLATVAWSPVQQDAGAEITVTSVLHALWLVAVAMTALSAGYCAKPRRIPESAATRISAALHRRYACEVRSAAVPWLLYGIGTAARLLAVGLTGRLGYVGDAATAVSSASGYQQVLNMLSLMAPLGVAVSALRVWREKARGALFTTCLLFAAEIVFGAIAGGKQNFVIGVLALVIPYTVARRKLPKAILASAIIVFLFLVIPFTASYRSTVRGGGTSLSAGNAVSDAPLVLRQVAAADSPAVLPQSLAYLAQRVQEIDAPAIIMQRTPSQIPFRSPVALAETPLVNLIPRALWHSKPILATGYEFSQQYYQLPSDVYTYSAITPYGDLYLHGGWISVITGMLLLGCGIRVLDDALDVRANPHAALLVLLLFPTLVKGEDDWTTLLAGIPAVILIWLTVVALSFVRRAR